MAILMYLAQPKSLDGAADTVIRRFDRGHVLASVEDDWVFGESEISDPIFEFITIKGAPASDFAHLVAERPDSGFGPAAPPRLKMLDLDNAKIASVDAVEAVEGEQVASKPVSKADVLLAVKDVVFEAEFIIEDPPIEEKP